MANPFLAVTKLAIKIYANVGLPYYRKLTLHVIKVLEINATEINAKEEVEFHRKLTQLRHSW